MGFFRAGQAGARARMTRTLNDEADWVVWNGSLGVLDMAAIGQTVTGAHGRSAFLEPPYDVVGPFSLDELETQGRIAFGACLVMSRRRWLEDQADLRMDARKRRLSSLSRSTFDDYQSEDRKALELPLDGHLETSQINSAFRRMAKTAHPDAGGSGEHYRRISQARDALAGACRQ